MESIYWRTLWQKAEFVGICSIELQSNGI